MVQPRDPIFWTPLPDPPPDPQKTQNFTENLKISRNFVHSSKKCAKFGTFSCVEKICRRSRRKAPKRGSVKSPGDPKICPFLCRVIYRTTLPLFWGGVPEAPVFSLFCVIFHLKKREFAKTCFWGVLDPLGVREAPVFFKKPPFRNLTKKGTRVK